MCDGVVPEHRGHTYRQSLLLTPLWTPFKRHQPPTQSSAEWQRCVYVCVSVHVQVLIKPSKWLLLTCQPTHSAIDVPTAATERVFWILIALLSSRDACIFFFYLYFKLYAEDGFESVILRLFKGGVIPACLTDPQRLCKLPSCLSSELHLGGI